MNEERKKDPRERPAPPRPHPDEICPVCGATGEPLSCKLVCPRCRIVLINCSAS